MEKLIDGANIEYALGRTMECHAVVDHPEEGWKPVNLLDYFDEQTAEIAAVALSRAVTEKVLARRNIRVGTALPLPECDGYPASRIFDFIHNKLGMEPMGRLAYVKAIPGHSVAGITDYQHLTSLVDKHNTNTYGEEAMAANPTNRYLGNIFNTMSVHGVAVHELTHLAGAQDVVNFFLDPTARHVT